jgi:hypothetical protein
MAACRPGASAPESAVASALAGPPTSTSTLQRFVVVSVTTKPRASTDALAGGVWFTEHARRSGVMSEWSP